MTERPGIDRPVTRVDVGLAQRYAKLMEHRREVAVDQFGQATAAALEEVSKRFSALTTATPLNAFELALQIELEFPGEAEEFMDRAVLLGAEHSIDPKRALIGVVLFERSKRG